ncbi:translation initiation factor IF-2-like [Falco peregrinus]|uniref:translation initiation factor IF-2-like n=1 Tax=Falco peregrinus TaxID=8954 RepID=UPI002479BBA8|nr:translation initiation factor IF-2-like [Falco peregrinus]
MAAVVKVFDSHEGVGEGKKGRREAPGPEPVPVATGARGAGERPPGKWRGGARPGGPRRAPAADTRGAAAFPVWALPSRPRRTRGREPWVAETGNRWGRTGPLRPARALRVGYRARGRRGPGAGADATPRPAGARSGPSSSRARAAGWSRGGGESPPVPFVPSAELRGRGRCWGFYPLGKDSGRAHPRNERFGNGTHQDGGARPGPAVPRALWTAAGPSPPGPPPPGAGREKHFGARLRSGGLGREGRSRHDPARPRGAAAAVQHHGERRCRCRCPVPGAGGRLLGPRPAMLQPRWGGGGGGGGGASDKRCPAPGVSGAGQKAPLLPGSSQCLRIGISASAAVRGSRPLQRQIFIYIIYSIDGAR